MTPEQKARLAELEAMYEKKGTVLGAGGMSSALKDELENLRFLAKKAEAPKSTSVTVDNRRNMPKTETSESYSDKDLGKYKGVSGKKVTKIGSNYYWTTPDGKEKIRLLTQKEIDEYRNK